MVKKIYKYDNMVTLYVKARSSEKAKIGDIIIERLENE